jgi:hypothetical protein
MTWQNRDKLRDRKCLRPVVLDGDKEANGSLPQNTVLTLSSKPPATVPKRLTPISVAMLILPPLDKQTIMVSGLTIGE